jgi:hypothetical protein
MSSPRLRRVVVIAAFATLALDSGTALAAAASPATTTAPTVTARQCRQGGGHEAGGGNTPSPRCNGGRYAGQVVTS